jgi:3-keto-disaccharide hydrolase
MKPSRLIYPIIFFVIGFGFSKVTKKDHWKQLYNGKDLTGWDTYIGPDLNDSGKFITGQPLGLNNDPRHVFTIVNQDGENLIRISGENWGAISTKDEFENYHLQLQFKWGALSWGQKKNKKKDSGLLYHSVGKYGADYGAWMRSQEFQIEEGNCGDYWGVAGGMADMPVIKKSETEYVYNPQGTMITFREGSKQGRRCIKGSDAENPTGQWNTVDLYCHGDTSIHVVNGVVMMILYNQKQSDNDQILPLTKGKIQIQSEGAEVFYRQIKIEPIDRLPKDLVSK